MKIKHIQDTIRIHGKSNIHGILKNLKSGSEIDAKIIRREGNHDAILDIAGKRIRAEFKKGVPANDTITLKLEDNKNNTYIFKLIGLDSGEKALKELTRFLIFDDFNDTNIKLLINKFLDGPPRGIFELNELFLTLLGKDLKKNSNINVLINRLLSLGVSRESVMAISFLLSDLYYDMGFILPFISLLDKKREYYKKLLSPDHENLEESLRKIFNEVDNISGSDEKNEVIQLLLDLLNNHGKTGSESYGEMLLAGDDEIISFRFLKDKESILLSVQLSHIGRLDILIRKEKDNLDISLFLESNDIIEYINNSINELHDALAQMNGTIHINIYNKKNIINKIVEINSHLTLNSVLDIKV